MKDNRAGCSRPSVQTQITSDDHIILFIAEVVETQKARITITAASQIIVGSLV